MLRLIHLNNVDAIPWQQASLRSIQQGLGTRSLFDCLFVFQPYQKTVVHEELSWFSSDFNFDINVHVSEVTGRIIVGDDLILFPQYPLNVELHETVDGFLVKGACSAEYMDSSEFNNVLEQYIHYLMDIIERPESIWSTCRGDTWMRKNIESDPPEQAPSGDVMMTDETWNETSSSLRELLASTTKVELSNIHLDTNLASLGVDSITAIQIVSRGRKLGLHVTAVDVIRSRTLYDLALKATVHNSHVENGIKDKSREDDGERIPTEQAASILAHFGNRAREDIQKISMPTAGMQWLIAAWRRSDGARFQHVFCYRLQADVNLSRLCQAWRTLLARHAILRSTFSCTDDGDPFIITFTPESIGTRWTEIEIEATDQDTLVDEAREWMESLVSTPPTMQAPMTHAYLLRSSQHAALAIHLHHFQYDAWSLELLLHDLYKIYQEEEPFSSNKGWSELCTVSSQKENTLLQQNYWTRIFPPGFHPVLFPNLLSASQHHPKFTNPRKHRVVIKPNAVSHASLLEAYAQSHFVSLQAVLLASWAKVQAYYTSTDHLTFGLWHSGRGLNVADIERLAVPCMNVLPLCVPNVGEETPINDIVRQIYEDLKARAGVVEQSELKRVHEWIGLEDISLCNVFVNFIKTASGMDDECAKMFAPMKVNAPYASRDNLISYIYLKIPYTIPEVASHISSTTTNLVNLLQVSSDIPMFSKL